MEGVVLTWGRGFGVEGVVSIWGRDFGQDCPLLQVTQRYCHTAGLY